MFITDQRDLSKNNKNLFFALTNPPPLSVLSPTGLQICSKALVTFPRSILQTLNQYYHKEIEHAAWNLYSWSQGAWANFFLTLSRYE